MRLGVFTAAVLFCLPGIPTVASAQAVAPELGARIRLTVPCELAPQQAPEQRNACVLIGRLAGWRADAIDLEVDGRRSSYNLNTVSQLEVSRGSRSHKLLGAGIGFVVGVGGAYQLFHSGGSTGMCNQSANQDAIDSRHCLGIYGLGGLAGAGLGAFIGTRIRTERWHRVSHGSVRMSLVTQGRFALKFAVAF
jgi:hypothetical protein